MDQPTSLFLAGDLLSLVGNNTHVVQYDAIYKAYSGSKYHFSVKQN